MDSAKISILVSGTHNDGAAYSETFNGQIEFQEYTETRGLLVDDAGETIKAAQDRVCSAYLITNTGANDGHVRIVNASSPSFALSIPAGASVIITPRWGGVSIGGTAVITLYAFTGQTTTFHVQEFR